MLRNQLRRAASGRLIFGTPQIGLLASQIISETATGDQGPGLLYDEALAQTGRQMRGKITSYTGTPGKLFVYENGSILVEGEADGAYTIGYDWEAWALDGSSVNTGSDTATVTIGPVNASVAAGEGIGTGSGTGGDAVGGVAGVDAGGTGTSTGSGSGGNASGGSAGSAFDAGGEGVSTGSGSGGDASAFSNASDPGGTGFSTGSGVGGAATGGGSFSGSLSQADIDAIASAVWTHSSAVSITIRMAEVWGRLGLDPSKPLIQNKVEITFGEVVMAMTSHGNEVTVTRQ